MKNKFILLILATLFTIGMSYGQVTQDSLPSVLNPEKTAQFKGGMDGWSKFLENNLDRDLLSTKGAPSGSYKVIGNFLIDSVGAVSDIRIETDPGYGAAKEFIRVLKLSNKKWIPAYDKGKAVPYRQKQSLTLFNNF